MATLYAAQGSDRSNSALYTVDPTNANTAAVNGNTGSSWAGFAFDFTDGTIYGVTAFNSLVGDPELAILNPVTGHVVTYLGLLGAPSGFEITDIVCDEAGVLYGLPNDGVTGVGTIDKTTGAFTSLGGDYVTPPGDVAGGLCFNGTDLLALSGTADGSGKLTRIDRATGNGTLVATLSGYNPAGGPPEINAASVGPDGVLLAILCLYDVSIPHAHLVSVAIDGTVTDIGLLGTRALDALAWDTPPPTPPAPPSGITLPDWGGASIAFGSQAFNPNPTWNGPLKGLKSVQIDRGRNYLLSKTQTGTMVETFHDTTGRYDPTNPASPYYPEIGPMRAACFQLTNPVDKSQNTLFTGFTETWDFTYPATPAAVIMDAAVHCVDGFDALNRAEMPPDSANRTTIPPFVGADAVAGRMLYILSFFQGAPYSGTGFPTDPAALFSGNVNVFDAVYNPQTSLLTGIQDTADAEFPNVSNTFMDKFGNLAFRGRATRFTPENYWNGAAHPPTLAKPISFWNVGDANACGTWPTNPPGSPSNGAMAPFNDLGWDLDQTTLVNACECYPGNIGTQTAALTNQLRTNGLSILKYGPRVLSIPDLYTVGSPASTGNPFLNPPGLTAKQETLLYADYFVKNLAVPEPHISTLKFVTVAPGTTRGNAWWKLVCGVELGDVIVLYTTNPGGGGFQAEQFFVEGIHYDIEIGGPYPQITLSLDVSPRKWFSVFNGFTFFPTNGFMAQDGQATHNSASFQSASFTFAPGNVGDRITILDLAAPAVPDVNPQQFTVAAYVSTHHVTLSSNFTGTTTSAAPWEIIGA